MNEALVKEPIKSFGDYVANVFDWNLSKEQKDCFNKEYEYALNIGIPQRNPEIFRKNGKILLSTWHMVMRNYYLTYYTLTESPDGGTGMHITCKKNGRRDSGRVSGSDTAKE